MKTYPHHPYADIFPFRTGQPLIDLSDNIAAYGQHEEIVLFDGQILEGRQRQAAMIRAGIQARYRTFGDRDGDGDDALQFAFNCNFHRRSLSEAERTIAAQAFATLRKGIHANPPNGASGESQDEAAKKFNVPKRNIQRAKVVMEKGVPELQEAYREEKVSLADAATVAAQCPPDIQRQALELVLSGEQSTLRAAAAQIQGTPPPAETGAGVAADLERLVARAARIGTSAIAERAQIVAVLRSAAAALRRLP